MKKSRITTALLAIGISASMVFQTPVFATEETAVAVSSGVTTNGISGWPQGPEITSASAVIMEDTSDTILYAKDMDTTLSPAGAVKIMTCLLALENSQLDDQVTMTETGVSGVTDGGAHISSQLGEVFTMEQCLYAPGRRTDRRICGCLCPENERPCQGAGMYQYGIHQSYRSPG